MVKIPREVDVTNWKIDPRECQVAAPIMSAQEMPITAGIDGIRQKKNHDQPVHRDSLYNFRQHKATIRREHSSRISARKFHPEKEECDGHQIQSAMRCGRRQQPGLMQIARQYVRAPARTIQRSSGVLCSSSCQAFDVG